MNDTVVSQLWFWTYSSLLQPSRTLTTTYHISTYKAYREYWNVMMFIPSWYFDKFIPRSICKLISIATISLNKSSMTTQRTQLKENKIITWFYSHFIIYQTFHKKFISRSNSTTMCYIIGDTQPIHRMYLTDPLVINFYLYILLKMTQPKHSNDYVLNDKLNDNRKLPCKGIKSGTPSQNYSRISILSWQKFLIITKSLSYIWGHTF